MAKRIEFDLEARDGIKRGVDALAILNIFFVVIQLREDHFLS